VRLGYNPKKPMNSPLPSLSLPSSKRGGENHPLRNCGRLAGWRMPRSDRLLSTGLGTALGLGIGRWLRWRATAAAKRWTLGDGPHLPSIGPPTTGKCRRTISGCSGDDYLRWQEMESAAKAAAAGEVGVTRASEPEGEHAGPKCAADGEHAGPKCAAHPITGTIRERSSAPRTVRASDNGEMLESLARNLQRAKARWKAMQGSRG
jgi:hypothetical protein